MILTPFHKLPKNVGDLGKIIVAKGFKKLPKVQSIAQSGHTGPSTNFLSFKTILAKDVDSEASATAENLKFCQCLIFWREIGY